MKFIKKRTELPFLMALGVLFILSASFLGLQFWSEGHNGAAMALEAPVMPPSLSAPQVVVAPPPVQDSHETAEVIEAPEEKKQPVPSAKKAAQTSVKKEVSKKSDKKEEVRRKKNKRSARRKSGAALQMPGAAREVAKQDKAADKSIETSSKAKEAVEVVSAPKAVESGDEKVAQGDSKPADLTEKSKVTGKPEKKAVREPVREPVVVAAKPEVKIEAKAAKKTAKRSTEIAIPAPEKPGVVQKRKVLEIPTEVPPEWDWFSTPLKLEVEDDGKVELLPGTGKVTIDEQMRDAVVIEPVLGNETQKRFQQTLVTKLPKKVEPKEKVKVMDKQEDKPFSTALGKMKRLRAGRKPADKTIRRVSPSLKRLQDMLRHLRMQKDNNYSATATESSRLDSEKAAQGRGAMGISESSTENEDKGSEKGLEQSRETSENGSIGLQMRYLVKSGSWLRN